MKEKFNWSTNTPQEPMLISITRLAKRLGFSRHHVWNLIDRDEIPAVKSSLTGNKWFVPMSFVKEFEKLLEQRSKEVMEKYEGDSK